MMDPSVHVSPYGATYASWAIESHCLQRHGTFSRWTKRDTEDSFSAESIVVHGHPWGLPVRDNDKESLQELGIEHTIATFGDDSSEAKETVVWSVTATPLPNMLVDTSAALLVCVEISAR